MQDHTNAQVREMTSYLLAKEYSENYTDKVSKPILDWITDPRCIRYALTTERMQGDKREELSAILKDLDRTTAFLMKYKKVQLIKREDYLETLSNLKVSEPYPSKTVAHYADMVLECLSGYLASGKSDE